MNQLPTALGRRAKKAKKEDPSMRRNYYKRSKSVVQEAKRNIKPTSANTDGLGKLKTHRVKHSVFQVPQAGSFLGLPIGR
jgi:hypothetical protein